MKAEIKNMIFLVTGLVAGGGLGVLGSKKYYEKKYSAIADRQIREMEEYYGLHDEYARGNVSVIDGFFGDEEVNPTNTERESGILSQEERDYIRKLRSDQRDAAGTDYRGFYHSPLDPAELEHPEDDDEEGVVINEATAEYQSRSTMRPKLISVDDLGDLPQHTEHSLLYYYTYDDVLTDEDGNEEENPEWLLGDALTKYGFVDDDNEEERIFVMNYELDVVYEIIKKEGSSEVEDYD